MKTVNVALVLALNIGIDPPDVIKLSPCARMECWIEPSQHEPKVALEYIGRALQAQVKIHSTKSMLENFYSIFF